MEESTLKTIKRSRILIKGIVQGVGFRPFLYRSAHEYQLTGSVKNTSQGVILEVEGETDKIDGFYARIIAEPPPLSLIEHHEAFDLPVEGSQTFEIIASEATDAGEGELMVSPDIAICGNCHKELFTQTDPRYRYPFINCTDCGPRFSIIRDLPYDRPKTTMKIFPMCRTCDTEYKDPFDRRYHAQPVSCYKCGPTLSLHGKDTLKIDTDDPLLLAAEKLKTGHILAIKGLGGYHLACKTMWHDGCDHDDPVKRMRDMKRRKKKPFALMATMDMIRQHAEVSETEQKLLETTASPILLLKWKKDKGISPYTAPDQDLIGFMLPYTPLHLLLMDLVKEPLVMTSANFSDEPIIYKDNLEVLAPLCDYILTNDRGIHIFTDDSVMRVVNEKPYMVRRSRGYVPLPLKMPVAYDKTIVALGPMLKTTLALMFNGKAIMSQYIGDTDSPESIEAERQALDHFTHIFRLKPAVLVVDKHPGYPNRELINHFPDAQVVEIQHHKAHVGSLMAETGETGNMIGISMDGTGYGDDGNIWGGEFFTGNVRQMERFGHLKYVFLPSGDLAAKEPWRFALSLLHAVYGNREEPMKRYGRAFGPKAEMLLEVIAKQAGGPMTSSAGRLFDGVAALLNLGTANDYEGELPIKLQALAETVTPSVMTGLTGHCYRFAIHDDHEAGNPDKNGKVLDLLPAIYDIMEDDGDDAVKAFLFHKTLAQGCVQMAEAARNETGFNTVGLTGGVFQNTLLLTLTEDLLKQKGFKVLTHSMVPPNDGGIALGQALLAAGQLLPEGQLLPPG